MTVENKTQLMNTVVDKTELYKQIYHSFIHGADSHIYVREISLDLTVKLNKTNLEILRAYLLEHEQYELIPNLPQLVQE